MCMYYVSEYDYSISLDNTNKQADFEDVSQSQYCCQERILRHRHLVKSPDRDLNVRKWDSKLENLSASLNFFSRIVQKNVTNSSKITNSLCCTILLIFAIFVYFSPKARQTAELRKLYQAVSTEHFKSQVNQLNTENCSLETETDLRSSGQGLTKMIPETRLRTETN